MFDFRRIFGSLISGADPIDRLRGGRLSEARECRQSGYAQR